MDSPAGSTIDLNARPTPRVRTLLVILALLVLAITLVIVSIIRNELRVVQMSQREATMLRKICEATVTNC